jgi:hypothetical protein
MNRRDAPLGDRPIRALTWIIERGAPCYWLDIVEATGGYRPSFHLVIRPLRRRGYIREAEGPKIGSYFEPTPEGRDFIATLDRCPTCGKVRTPGP